MTVPPVPVTVLSGFLGAGKTTVLKALLSSGHVAPSSIGLIVNDLAEVNVDARLVAEDSPQPPESVDTSWASEEMQGACACCSGRDQLLESVARLATREPPLRHIIVECSGMANPANIVRLLLPQSQQDQAGPPSTFSLSGVVTVIDTSALGAWIASSGSSLANLTEQNTNAKPAESKDVRPPLEGWGLPGSMSALQADSGTARTHAKPQAISDLFIAQIEWASVVLLHKIDRVKPSDVSSCLSLVRALNPAASIHCVRFGVVPPDVIIHPTRVYSTQMSTWLHANHITGHPHAPPLETSTDNGRCNSAAGPSGAMSASACGGSNREGESPGNSEHRHPHYTVPARDCDNGAASSFAAEAGSGVGAVSSFVFNSFRPFHPVRLQMLIRRIRKEFPGLEGHAAGVPWENQAGHDGGAPAEEGQRLMKGVLRSKGLVWVAPDMVLSREWAQCRGVLELQKGAPWRCTAASQAVSQKGSYGPCTAELFKDLPYQDRRQEIVFIGTEAMDAAYIRHELTSCLLSDEEYALGPEGWAKTLKDKIALTLSVAARIEASRIPSTHGSSCPCCDPSMRELMGSTITLY